jgi:hypothetical protein
MTQPEGWLRRTPPARTSTRTSRCSSRTETNCSARCTSHTHLRSPGVAHVRVPHLPPPPSPNFWYCRQLKLMCGRRRNSLASRLWPRRCQHPCGVESREGAPCSPTFDPDLVPPLFVACPPRSTQQVTEPPTTTPRRVPSFSCNLLMDDEQASRRVHTVTHAHTDTNQSPPSCRHARYADLHIHLDNARAITVGHSRIARTHAWITRHNCGPGNLCDATLSTRSWSFFARSKKTM